MVFFNNDYFTEINEHLLAQFMLAFKVELETALHFHDEGYEGGDD